MPKLLVQFPDRLGEMRLALLPEASSSGSPFDGQVNAVRTSIMVESSEWTAIQHVVDRLKQTHPDVPPDTVTTVVHHNHARFDGRPLRDYVPLFVERGSRRALAELGG